MADSVSKQYDHANYVKTRELICKIRASIFQLKSLLTETAVYITAVHCYLS